MGLGGRTRPGWVLAGGQLPAIWRDGASSPAGCKTIEVNGAHPARARPALHRPPGLPSRVESVTKQHELAEVGVPSRRRRTGVCRPRENWKSKNETKDSPPCRSAIPLRKSGGRRES